MSYKYKSPTEHGYEKFRLSRREHNVIRSNHKQNVFTKIEAYYSEHAVEFEYTTNLLGKSVSILLLPFAILMNGLGSLTEIGKEVRDLFAEKRRGSFVSERVHRLKHDKSPCERFKELERIYFERNGGD